ncbi:unnamed protein product, partial [Ectocarpus sp. 4 AP-2014]
STHIRLLEGDVSSVPWCHVHEREHDLHSVSGCPLVHRPRTLFAAQGRSPKEGEAQQQLCTSSTTGRRPKNISRAWKPRGPTTDTPPERRVRNKNIHFSEQNQIARKSSSSSI